MSINFEEDSISELPSDDKIEAISSMVSNMAFLQGVVAGLQARLEEETAKLRRIEEVDLPLALKDCGVKDITLTDGTKVEIKEDIYASITKANEGAAHAWLTSHGFGDVVKSTVVFDFGRGESQNRDALIAMTKDVAYLSAPKVKEAVNANTLKALVREQLAEGKEIPLELFGVFKKEVAVLKKK